MKEYTFDRIYKGRTMAQGIRVKANNIRQARYRAKKLDAQYNPYEQPRTILKFRNK
ncbi:hypothetical protein ACFL4H_00180 [Candidatus Neomarinimicrobiota bacterium]